MGFEQSALIEKYFSCRPLSREEYDFAEEIIKSALEKEPQSLTEFEKGITERLKNMPLTECNDDG